MHAHLKNVITAGDAQDVFPAVHDNGILEEFTFSAEVKNLIFFKFCLHLKMTSDIIAFVPHWAIAKW
jgi:hypothetical protein